jgi:hypothetical protein
MNPARFFRKSTQSTTYDPLMNPFARVINESSPTQVGRSTTLPSFKGGFNSFGFGSNTGHTTSIPSTSSITNPVPPISSITNPVPSNVGDIITSTLSNSPKKSPVEIMDKMMEELNKK